MRLDVTCLGYLRYLIYAIGREIPYLLAFTFLPYYTHKRKEQGQKKKRKKEQVQCQIEI
jgi:hypothetical protein